MARNPCRSLTVVLDAAKINGPAAKHAMAPPAAACPRSPMPAAWLQPPCKHSQQQLAAAPTRLNLDVLLGHKRLHLHTGCHLQNRGCKQGGVCWWSTVEMHAREKCMPGIRPARAIIPPPKLRTGAGVQQQAGTKGSTEHTRT